MPKFTYPIVFILNDGNKEYCGAIPDLGLFADGDKLEDVYAVAEELIKQYFVLAVKHGLEVPSPSTLEETIDKWKNYKVSLITANIPD